MPINGRRPFSEIVECTQNEIVREGAPGEEAKYFGVVNQVYSNDLPAILPELMIKKEAYFTLTADNTVGTVTVGTGTSNIIGVGTSWTSANSDGMLINIGSFDAIYRVTFDVSTSLTYQDSLAWVASSGTGFSYVLYKDRYQLPSDFSHMIADDPTDPHVVYRYAGGEKIFLNQLTEEEFEHYTSSSVGIPHAYCVKWIKETPYLYMTLAADSVEIVGYSYVPQLTTLSEYTSGTCTFAASTAVIATTAASWAVNVTTGTNTYFIRNDADGTGSASKWVRISSVANATALTLASTWGFTTGTGQNYTISEISKWPARYDDALIYKTALIVDPDGVHTDKWNAIYQDCIGLKKSEDARRSSTSTFKSFPGVRK